MVERLKQLFRKETYPFKPEDFGFTSIPVNNEKDWKKGWTMESESELLSFWHVLLGYNGKYVIGYFHFYDGFCLHMYLEYQGRIRSFVEALDIFEEHKIW